MTWIRNKDKESVAAEDGVPCGDVSHASTAVPAAGNGDNDGNAEASEPALSIIERSQSGGMVPQHRLRNAHVPHRRGSFKFSVAGCLVGADG